jgi:DNA-binding NtrC family response regulator
MSERIYPSFRILLVDDEPAWLDSLSLTLERGADITNTILCHDSRQVIDILSQEKVGLVLLDLTMPRITGQELLKLIAEQYPEIVVIILSGINQLETAVTCMKLGAFDYFVKTDDVDRLINGVLHAIRIIEMQMENREIRNRLLADSLEHPEAFAEIITVNKTMRSIFQYIESIAVSTQPILITGESGVGKELAARAIHSLSGSAGPMICVNIAGLDESVFADTLFGHVKGAYTGADTARNGLIEEAAQGMLFLDEIGDLSIPSQVKLLRILHDGEYFQIGSDKPKRSRARIVVATNQDLPAKMAEGQFRKDLYYRLQIHKLHIPPLRERKEDIPLLLDHFLEEAAVTLDKTQVTSPRQLVNLLETYDFPGNVRELRSVIFDAVTRHKSGVLSMDSFLAVLGKQDFSPTAIVSSNIERQNVFARLDTLPSPETAVNLLIEEAMKRSKGNQSLAARLLGISQSALNKRLRRAEQRSDQN